MKRTNESEALNNQSLYVQLVKYIILQKKRYIARGLRPIKTEKFMDWTQRFAGQFLLSRRKRADDLGKPDFRDARNMEEKFIGAGNQHFMVDCMDGRNIPAIMLSHVPHVGGVIHTQAGDFFGVSEGSAKGSFIYDEDSYIYLRIVELLTKNKGEKIHYSFDSHFDNHSGCAARSGIAATFGSADSDNGLREDIKKKMVLGRWLRHVQNKISAHEHQAADIKPQFFSYNSSEGTMLMGLEMYADLVDRGFTKEVIQRLKREKKIVDTWDFIKDKKVSTILAQKVKPADFRKEFVRSMRENWTVITKLYDGGSGNVYLKIWDALVQIYEKGGWKVTGVNGEDDFDSGKISKDVLAMKAKVMLKNLVTRWSIASDKPEWPYDKHVEQAIVLTEGGYGPFEDIDIFSVYSKEDMSAMSGHIYKSIDILRNARRRGAAGGITDPMGVLFGEDFVEAPILIFNKAIVREFDEESWKTLEGIDWTSLWAGFKWESEDGGSVNWTRTDFVDFLDNFPDWAVRKFKITDITKFYNAAYELFDRTREMVRDGQRYNPQLRDGKLLVVNLITDKDRRARVLVPIPV